MPHHWLIPHSHTLCTVCVFVYLFLSVFVCTVLHCKVLSQLIHTLVCILYLYLYLYLYLHFNAIKWTALSTTDDQVAEHSQIPNGLYVAFEASPGIEGSRSKRDHRLILCTTLADIMRINQEFCTITMSSQLKDWSLLPTSPHQHNICRLALLQNQGFLSFLKHLH